MARVVAVVLCALLGGAVSGSGLFGCGRGAHKPSLLELDAARSARPEAPPERALDASRESGRERQGAAEDAGDSAAAPVSWDGAASPTREASVAPSAATLDATSPARSDGPMPPADASSAPTPKLPGASDASSAGPADAGATAVRELSGPSYRGSVDNGADCSRLYPTRGFAPAERGSTRHPLFLYFVGTAFDTRDPTASYDALAALAVARAAAARGFVALSVQYDNSAAAWYSDHQNQLRCLFQPALTESLLSAACALPEVDCTLGIATWGHSQGGLLAAHAYNYDRRVRAVWTTGYGGFGEEQLPRERLRVVNGESDGDIGQASTLLRLTGLSASACPDADQCLRADGSGFIIVRAAALAEPASSSADHCWFDRASCTATRVRLEPSWIDPRSERPFALAQNLDWVVRTLRR